MYRLGTLQCVKKMKLFRASLGGFGSRRPFHPRPSIEMSNMRMVFVQYLDWGSWQWVVSRSHNKSLSLNYLWLGSVNPLDLDDYRYRNQHAVQCQPHSRCTASVIDNISTHNSVVMEGVSEFDLRSNVGLGFSFPPKKKSKGPN